MWAHLWSFKPINWIVDNKKDKEIESDNKNMRQAEMFKQAQVKKYKSGPAVLLRKNDLLKGKLFWLKDSKNTPI